MVKAENSFDWLMPLSVTHVLQTRIRLFVFLFCVNIVATLMSIFTDVVVLILWGVFFLNLSLDVREHIPKQTIRIIGFHVL